MARVNLMVVDDHALFRAGLVSLLNEMPDFVVCGEASNGEEALAVYRRDKPDVVLLDVNMPVKNGIETVCARRELDKNCRIIMLTISKKDEDLFGAIQAGAEGYLLKNAEPEELRSAILNVYEGKSVLSPEVTHTLLKAVAGMQGHTTDGGLSSREIEVLECLAKGKTTLQISLELYVSENTVKTHVRHILEKLEASNRAEAVSRAIQLGILKAND